jgi:hypothetical protein
MISWLDEVAASAPLRTGHQAERQRSRHRDIARWGDALSIFPGA